MKQNFYIPLAIFITNLLIYALFNYGGIRSPDSEIVFRTTESLVKSGEFAVSDAISWNYFGLGPGKDGKRYSIFGPAQSIMAAPLLQFAYYLKNNKIHLIDSDKIPISFHVFNDDKDAGLYFLEGSRPLNLNGHFERFIVSYFNTLVGALSSVFFYLLILKIVNASSISLLITFIYSFGSLIFSYTGTFFSEPLCVLFVILSFLFIIRNELSSELVFNKNYFYSGVFLGLAVTTHISAVLSIPFYYMFILGQHSNTKLQLKQFLFSSIYFSLGLGIFILLLFYYNYSRFGNILETGRSADPLFHYAIYTNPLPGIYGLLLSPGKGLLIFSPIIILSIIFWPSFHKKYPHISIGIIGMIIVRILFLASRSDWHGGFALGPRYLLIIIPFLFVPIALGIKDLVKKQKNKNLLLVNFFSFICIIQQTYFSMGEIFSFLHLICRGEEIIADNNLYFNWEYSPALYLLNHKTGPFLLGIFINDAYKIWVIMSLIFILFFSVMTYFIYKKNSISNFSLQE